VPLGGGQILLGKRSGSKDLGIGMTESRGAKAVRNLARLPLTRNEEGVCPSARAASDAARRASSCLSQDLRRRMSLKPEASPRLTERLESRGGDWRFVPHGGTREQTTP